MEMAHIQLLPEADKATRRARPWLSTAMERGESGAGDPRMIQNEEHQVAGSYGDERARDVSGWGGRRDWIRKEMSNEGIRKRSHACRGRCTGPNSLAFVPRVWLNRRLDR